MDKSTTIATITAAVAGLLSAGAFKFYEFFLKNKREVQKEQKEEELKYRDDLIRRVEKLESERNDHLEQIMELTSGISGLRVEVDYIKRENELLKLKIDAMR
jgi:predicted nuclease with TOPRIM domain|tara:strand:- start:111 stop:416 length:306 start_codon:yes stop_codon:yes gene_type:complete